MKKLFLLSILIPLLSWSQDDLLNEIEGDLVDDGYENAAFKGLKIVNFESTKMVTKKQLYFVVSHRFTSIENGIDDFFGLDAAVTRLNFIYGITDGINFGVSRSSFQKTYESSLKLRLLRQKKQGSPFSVVLFNTMLINTALEKEQIPNLEFKHRLSYAVQGLISRKFSQNFSLELAPTYYHDNLTSVDEQENSQYALGVGLRQKLTKRWSVNIDYGVNFNRADSSPFKNPLSIGFDLETGGHVFQLHFTNAQPMNLNTFLGQATGDWGKQDIFFGFNLSRVF